MRTKLVGTFTALEGGVGLLPKALGIHKNAKLPRKESGDGNKNQADRIESTHKDHGRHHHKMIPIEDAAGRAATVFHDKAEGTPDENTDQIAHIEASTDEEKDLFADDVRVIQGGKDGKKSDPEEENLIRRARCGNDMIAKGGIVDRFLEGAEASTEELTRANGKLFPYRNELTKHIKHPKHPKKVQGADLGKKASTLQHREKFGLEDKQKHEGNENKRTQHKSYKIISSEI